MYSVFGIDKPPLSTAHVLHDNSA